MRDGWVETTLGEILTDCKNGKNYREDDESRGLPITRIQTISEGEINLNKVGYGNLNESNSGDFLLTNGDILFSHINSLPHVGKVAFVNSEVLPLIHGMNLLRMKFNNSCDPKFMFFTMQHDATREKVRAIAQRAVNQVSVTISKIKSIQIILPPLAEQKRIVDLISSVDSYIEALQQQVDKARKSRNAVLHELLTKGGDGWVETTIGEVIEHTIGGAWGGEPGSQEVNVHVVRSTEFTKSGYLNFNTGVTRSIKNSQLKSRELKSGDILLEKSGGGPDQPVGRVVFVTSEIPERTVCSNFVQLIRPDNDQVNSFFLFLVLWRWHSINRTLEFQAQTTGIRNLRTPDYLEQTFKLPPLAEQKRIVEIMSVFDNQIEALDSTIAKTQNLRSALLSDLLSGNHEIPTTYDKLIGAA